MGDDLICRVVGESEAAVGLDDLGMDRIAIPGVDVITVVADVEADGNLAGAGDGLPSDQRSVGVGVGDVPQLDNEGRARREGQPLPVGDRAGHGHVGLAARWHFLRRVGWPGLDLAGSGEQENPDAEEGTHGGLDSGRHAGNLGNEDPMRF